MACGDRYRALIVTTGGLNLENPWDGFATFNDYEEWRSLARRLTVQAQEAHDKLGELEGEPFDRWNALVADRNALIEASDALPSEWQAVPFVTKPEDWIADAQRVATDAVCFLDRANEAIEAAGGTPDELPVGPPPREDTGPLGLGSIPWGAVIIAGVAIWAFTRR